MSSEKLSLKLVIDIKRNKVLYAEAGKSVVDFLFSLVAMPVGTVVKLLNENIKDGITSGIAKVYQSIEQLDEKYLQPNQPKNLLLDPVILSRVSINSFLLPEFVSGSEPMVFYRCNCKYVESTHYFTDNCGSQCPICKSYLNIATQIMGEELVDAFPITEVGGIVRGLTTYTIADDLTVTPMATVSSFVFLNRFNIKDLEFLEEKNIDLSVEKGMELLKASLQSKTVLSDVFLGMNKI